MKHSFIFIQWLIYHSSKQNWPQYILLDVTNDLFLSLLVMKESQDMDRDLQQIEPKLVYIEWLLFNAKWLSFQRYYEKNELYFDEMMMSALYNWPMWFSNIKILSRMYMLHTKNYNFFFIPFIILYILWRVIPGKVWGDL